MECYNHFPGLFSAERRTPLLHPPARPNIDRLVEQNSLVDSTPLHNPDYRRPKFRTLQRSLSVPIGTFIFLYWSIVALFVLVPIWQRVDWEAHALCWPTTPLWLKNTSPYILAVLTVSVRVGLFFIFGISRLEAIASRVRHERIAKSFDFIKSNELELEIPARLSVEPLYQYQPLLLITMPLFISAYLIAAPVPQCAVDELPPELSRVYQNNARKMGIALLLETGLRVVLEIVWRYLRIDTEGCEHLGLRIMARLAVLRDHVRRLGFTNDSVAWERNQYSLIPS